MTRTALDTRHSIDHVRGNKAADDVGGVAPCVPDSWSLRRQLSGEFLLKGGPIPADSGLGTTDWRYR